MTEFESMAVQQFKNISDGLKEINCRLDNVDKRLDNVDKRLDNVDKRLDNIENQLAELKEEHEITRTAVNVYGEKLDDLIEVLEDTKVIPKKVV